MIKITIERLSKTTYTTKENVVTKETPTAILKESDYGNRRENMMEREFAVVEVTKHADTRQTLLEQEISNEETFNLARVIVAINNITLCFLLAVALTFAGCDYRSCRIQKTAACRVPDHYPIDKNGGV